MAKKRTRTIATLAYRSEDVKAPVQSISYEKSPAWMKAESLFN